MTGATPLESARVAFDRLTEYDVEHQSVEYARFLHALASLPLIEDVCFESAKEVAGSHGFEFDGDDLIESDPDIEMYNEADRLYDERREG